MTSTITNTGVSWSQKPCTILNGIANANPKEKISLTGSVLNCCRNVVHSMAYFCRSNARPLEPLKMFAFISVPMRIAAIVSTVFSFKNSSRNEKIDSALDISAGVGTVTGGISTAAGGLAGAGAVGVKSIAWASPLGIIGSVFSCFDIILTTKKLIEGCRFSKELKGAAAFGKSAEGGILNDYKNVRELIETKQSKENSFISKHFDISPKVLIASMKRIEDTATEIFATGDFDKIAHCNKALKSTMETLVDRVTATKNSKIYSIARNVLGLIGFGLFFSPLIAVGFATVAVNSVWSVADIIGKNISRNRFEKQLETMEQAL
ncbi:MAG: hypothetical protein WCF65_00605 [Parachlamydiaceae bacterium]